MLFGKHVNKFYKKYFWYFFWGILFLLFVDIIQIFIPIIIGNIVDAITNGISSTIDYSKPFINTSNYKFLIEEAIWIAMIGFGMFIGRLSWRICILGEAVRIQADLRSDMFQKSEILSQRYYKSNKTGAILSYFSNDLETIEEAFGFVKAYLDKEYKWRIFQVLLLPQKSW